MEAITSVIDVSSKWSYVPAMADNKGKVGSNRESEPVFTNPWSWVLKGLAFLHGAKFFFWLSFPLPGLLFPSSCVWPELIKA